MNARRPLLVLVLVLLAVFGFSLGFLLSIPKASAQAELPGEPTPPAPPPPTPSSACQVVAGRGDFANNVVINGNLDVGAIWVHGGCLGSGKSCTSGVQCGCDDLGGIATVQCPAGMFVIAGGCEAGGAANVRIDNPEPGGTGWRCDFDGVPLDEQAWALCARIKTTGR